MDPDDPLPSTEVVLFESADQILSVEQLRNLLSSKTRDEKVVILDEVAHHLAAQSAEKDQLASVLRDIRREEMGDTITTSDEDSWTVINAAADRHENNRNRQQEVTTRLEKVLSTAVVNAIFARISVKGDSAYKNMNAWATVLQTEGQSQNPAHVNLRLSHAVFYRLHKKGAQKSSGTAVRAVDLAALKGKEVPHYTIQDIQDKGYDLDANNVLIYAQASIAGPGRVLGTIRPSQEPPMLTAFPHGHGTRATRSTTRQLTQNTFAPPLVGPVTALGLPDPLYIPPSTSFDEEVEATASTEAPTAVPTTHSTNNGLAALSKDELVATALSLASGIVAMDATTHTDNVTSGSGPPDVEEDSSDHNAPRSSASSFHPDPGEDDPADTTALDETVGEEATTTAGTKKCSCPPAMPKPFLRFIDNHKIKPHDTPEHAKLVTQWNLYTEKHGAVCYSHLMKLLAAIGFKTKSLGTVSGVNRMRLYLDAFNNSTVGDLKTDGETYKWFRRAYRPHRPSDALGTYNYAPVVSKPIMLTLDQQRVLCGDLGIDYDEWDRVGSINLECFAWWSTITIGEALGKDTNLEDPEMNLTLMDLFLEEFDMYRHHLRHVNGSPDLGWGRNQYHSLVQQAMRQDPQYWLMYCALRPDGHTSLVSYPYYVKHAVPGSSTFFRHIDLNIKNLAENGRGANQIQGTVSLDDESATECTEIIPGMHKHLEEWSNDLHARGLDNSCFVQRIEAKHFTKEDAAKFHTQWTPVPCRRGDIRITLPHLPHGSMGPATSVRRTMLPWFVAVIEDGSLEVVESGTFDDIAAGHRDLMPARNSPSGLSNRYGAITFPFPAATHLYGMGLVSDSLVARVRPENPALLLLKNRLLFDAPYRTKYIKEWRLKLVRTVFGLYQDYVKPTERAAFGEKSYYNLKDADNLDTPLQVDGVAVDDEDDEGEDNVNRIADAHGNEGGEGGVTEETLMSTTVDSLSSGEAEED